MRISVATRAEATGLIHVSAGRYVNKAHLGIVPIAATRVWLN